MPTRTYKKTNNSSESILNAKNDWELINDFDHLIDKKSLFTSNSHTNFSQNNSNSDLKKHIKNKFSGSSTEYFGPKKFPILLPLTPNKRNNIQSPESILMSPQQDLSDLCQKIFEKNEIDDIHSPLSNITNHNSSKFGVNEITPNKKHLQIRKRLSDLIDHTNENSIQTFDLFDAENEESQQNTNWHINNSNRHSDFSDPISVSTSYKTTSMSSYIQNLPIEWTNSSILQISSDEVFTDTSNPPLSPKNLPSNNNHPNDFVNVRSKLLQLQQKNPSLKRDCISFNKNDDDVSLWLANATKKLKICDRSYSSVCGGDSLLHQYKNNSTSKINNNHWLPLPMNQNKSHTYDDSNKTLNKNNLLLYNSASSTTTNITPPSSPNTTDNMYSNRRFIGDFSRQCEFPVIDGDHNDLLTITAKTLASFVRSSYNISTETYNHPKFNIIIVDCRYPYEYNGGHIKGAINIYKCEDLCSYFITNATSKVFHKNGKKPILIFHCEFSSKRGPRLARFLRNQDRNIHKDCYPKLYYPEIYILQGGYAQFHSISKELCEPRNYITMDDKRYNENLSLYQKETSRSLSSISDTALQQGIHLTRKLPIFKKRIL